MGVNLRAKLGALISSSCQRVRPPRFIFDPPLGFYLRMRHKTKNVFHHQEKTAGMQLSVFSANTGLLAHTWFHCLKTTLCFFFSELEKPMLGQLPN